MQANFMHEHTTLFLCNCIFPPRGVGVSPLGYALGEYAHPLGVYVPYPPSCPKCRGITSSYSLALTTAIQTLWLFRTCLTPTAHCTSLCVCTEVMMLAASGLHLVPMCNSVTTGCICAPLYSL
jgi:hypothetical protein